MTDQSATTRRASWKRVAFGDVVRHVKDRVDPESSGLSRYVAGEHMESGELRIRSWGVVGDGHLGPAFHMRFVPGQVLYGSRRTYLRKVALADFEGITANTTFVLESADPKALLPEMLPFIMQSESFSQHSVRESKGSVNPYVNFSDLAWFEFDLPPMDEQIRLARLLRLSSGAAAAMRDVARKAEAVRDALLKRLGQQAELHGQPAPIGDLLRLSRRVVDPRPDQLYREIGIRSFGKGVFHKTPCKGSEIGEKRVFAVEPGRLIFNVVFAWEGAVAMTSDADAGFVASHRFPMYEAADDRVSLEFLYYYFLTPIGLRKLGDASPGGAGRNRTLGQDRFSQLVVPIPSVAVQRALVREVQATEAALPSGFARADQLQSLHVGLVQMCLGESRT